MSNEPTRIRFAARASLLLIVVGLGALGVQPLLAPRAAVAQSGGTSGDARAASARPPETVLTGLDVLIRDGFKPLAGRKIGLITNHTAIDREGRSIVQILHAAPGVTIVALFSPEHGLYGVKDEKVGHGADPQTGLKVYSLYGETRRPTDEMLAGVDTLVFDIQDIGTRFYTYIATMGYAMEEAARHKLRFVVLDRPNPITGTRVFGPMPDREGEFTSYHRTPLVHGMTVGELARMFNEERAIHADLQVIPCEGWKRAMWWDETGLLWVNPSPNMRSLTEAALYPAIGLIEACAVSVGRGTDTPFERFGAPWMHGRAAAAALNARGLAGVRFVPFRFTPAASKFKDKECGGVQVILTDRDAFDPLETGLTIVRVLMELHPRDFDVDKVNNLLFNRAILEQVKKSPPTGSFSRLWESDLAAFRAAREKFLLYP